jgi:hypothetical protein
MAVGALAVGIGEGEWGIEDAEVDARVTKELDKRACLGLGLA